MKPLVESVPNFSEGRRPEVIHAIVEALRTVPEVHILNVQSDTDHNRTVVTLAGPPQAVTEALFQGIATAAARIDLREHTGAHPRIGAADVVPIIPIQGVTMEECIALAHALGRRVGETLELPVYLYEAAAQRPERTNLENIRRGEYEGLLESLGRDPERAPDFGPARLGPAGAVVIGARPYLIAFNAYLNTNNVQIASQIARAIRNSNGGFRFVKALGLLVAGQAQVSMNFTDFTQTPLARVMEAIRREAAHHGTLVTHTELIGLIPEQALIDAAQWHLQLEGFNPDQILERRLAALNEAPPPQAFLDAVAAGSPAPGGGAAAALTGALAAALAAMVARLTAPKRKYAAVTEKMGTLALEAETLRTQLVRHLDEDVQAYNAVITARRLPETSGVHLQQALIRATEVPLQTARDTLAVLTLLEQISRLGYIPALGDAATGSWLAMGALQSALLMARLNIQSLQNPELTAAWSAELETLEKEARLLLTAIQAQTLQRTGLASPPPSAQEA